MYESVVCCLSFVILKFNLRTEKNAISFFVYDSNINKQIMLFFSNFGNLNQK